MHSNISECDSELQIPSKKIKLSSTQENIKTRERILSKVLQKEIQQEINLRKDDLELIEGNIFLVRQKLTRLKQVLASEYYRQKSVKGTLQYPHHPAVKDTFVGKSPVGYENHNSNSSVSNDVEIVENHVIVKKEIETDEEVDSMTASAEIKKLFQSNKLPCYIPPKNTDDNVVKPTEPRGIDSKKEIRIIVGNVSKWLAPLESSDATHKWTVYAKLAQTNLDIALFVNKVIFFLHKSYRPNDIIEIKYPPFKLTRRGWGEFPLKAQFHFKSPDNPPIDVMHHLKLDHVHTGFETFGAETSLTVWVHYPVQNGIVQVKREQPEKVSIKTENETKINEHHISKKLKNNHHENIFDNSDVMSDLSLNANIEPFESDINSGSFSFPEHSCDSESISSLFDEIKQEELQSFSSLLSSYEDKVHINQNCIKENYCKEAELNAVTNKITEDKTNIVETISSRNFPEINTEQKKIVQVKLEIGQNFSPTHDLNSDKQKIIEVKPKIEEISSEISFNEFDSEGLFLDECAVVAEEIVIDCDDCESDNCNKGGEIEENKKTSLQESIDTKDHRQTIETHIPSSSFNSIESNAIISSESNFISIQQKHRNNNYKCESTLDEIIQQLGIDVQESKALISHGTEAHKLGQTKSTEVLSVLKDQESNKIIPKNSIDVVNGLVLNNTRKAQKNTEKKSMIITLQKENGQIILRKEAKVQKFKESSPKKGIITNEKKPILINNKSLANSNATAIKNSRITVDVKKQLPVKRPNQLSNTTKNAQSISRIIPAEVVNSSLQKKPLSGISILKKVKNITKEDRYEDISNRDLVRQCPVQNTEIAVNWLMKRFPLVDIRSNIASFHQKHPYCAKDRDSFLNWPFAKQRAAEWMRAKAIGRILNEIPDLQKWTTLEILDWARVRCYTPIKNTPEPSLDFVYRPRVDGIVDFLKKEKVLTEKEVLDVTSDYPAKEEISKLGDADKPAGTSQDVNNKNSIVLALDKELEGFESYVNKCMTNAIGVKPSKEELLPGVHYPAVERILVSVFSSITEELIRRSYNASWIRHCDNPSPEISITDVKAAILSRKEFDFLLPFSDDKGKEKPFVTSYFRK